MPDIFGSFYIRNEGNGCLTSKFLEHSDTTHYTECCKKSKIDNCDDLFAGDYKTTWLEPNRSRTADLKIDRTGDIYKLYWTNILDSNWEYVGQAMLLEDKLVGSYWKK